MPAARNWKHWVNTILTFSATGAILFSNLSLNYLSGVAASSDILFSDDFESGNFDQWDTQDNTWSVNSINGSRKFGSTISTQNQSTHATAGDTAWTNYSLAAEIYAESGSDKNLMFRYQDVNNKYGLHIVNFQDHLYDGICLEKWVGGTFSDKCKWGIATYNQTDIRVRILAVGTAVRIYVNDNIIFDESNWGPIPSGKIGLRIAAGANYPAKVWYDNISVRQLSSLPTPLPVPILKQTDIRWGGDIYDSASTWASPAPPTISRWGCAITSAAMNFLYQGVTQSPDGSPVTPRSINNWLLSQPDGYIGNGYVNWWALRRFTKQVHDQYGSPILDFRKFASFDSGILNAHLGNLNPDILGVNNNSHFVVATGQSIGSYFINDPYFSKTELSQYGQVGSMMYYYPTSTNLSAIYLSTNPDVKLFLTNPSGYKLGQDPASGILTIPAYANYGSVDPLVDDEGNQTDGFGYKELALPEPADSPYTLTVWSSDLSPYTLQMIGYDRNNNPYISTLSGIVNNNSHAVFNFNYSQTDPSGIQNPIRVLTFDTFRKDIQLAFLIGWITPRPTMEHLINIVDLLEREYYNHRENPVKATANRFRKTLDRFEDQNKINERTKILLLDDLARLGF